MYDSRLYSVRYFYLKKLIVLLMAILVLILIAVRFYGLTKIGALLSLEMLALRGTATPVALASVIETATATEKPTLIPLVTVTMMPTSTPTATATATATPTMTETATSTDTPTPTSTNTPTPTGTATAMVTLTSTATPTATATETPTSTPTATLTPTATPTATPVGFPYVVGWCDTLSSIACRFGTTEEAILQANNLTDPSHIQIGQTLLIPIPLPAEPVAHVVQPGDTLSSLAERYDTTVEAIAWFNCIFDPRRIQAGQRLFIVPVAAAPHCGPILHIVQPGETLTSIAILYGTTPEAIAIANNLSNANLIFVGQVLQIP